MKVIEIIKTDNLNEGILGKILGKPLDYILSILGKGSAGRGMEALAYHVDRTGRLNINSIRTQYGQRFADDLVRNPSLIKKIEKKALSVRNAENLNANVADINALMSSTKQVGSSILGGLQMLAKLAVGYTIITPWREYLATMDEAEQKVESGEYTSAVYENERKKQIGILIGRLAAAFVGFKVAKVPGGILKYILPKRLAPLIDTLTPVGQAYIMNWLNNEANANAIATLMVEPVAFGISTGDVVSNLYLKAESALKTAAQTQSGQEPEQDIQDTETQTTPTPGATPAQPQPQPATVEPASTADEPVGAARDKSKWIPYGPGLIKNPETGEITLK